MNVLDSAVVSSATKPPLTPGQRVARERNRKGWTQEELAAAAGCTATTISNLERDLRKGRATVEAVAAALETTPEALGFRIRKPLRANQLNARQRELIDELLSLPEDEQTAVRKLLAEMRATRSER